MNRCVLTITYKDDCVVKIRLSNSIFEIYSKEGDPKKFLANTIAILKKVLSMISSIYQCLIE